MVAKTENVIVTRGDAAAAGGQIASRRNAANQTAIITDDGIKSAYSPGSVASWRQTAVFRATPGAGDLIVDSFKGPAAGEGDWTYRKTVMTVGFGKNLVLTHMKAGEAANDQIFISSGLAPGAQITLRADSKLDIWHNGTNWVVLTDSLELILGSLTHQMLMSTGVPGEVSVVNLGIAGGGFPGFEIGTDTTITNKDEIAQRRMAQIGLEKTIALGSSDQTSLNLAAAINTEVIRASSSAAINILGIAPRTAGQWNLRTRVYNFGTFAWTIKHQDAGASGDTSKIITQTGGDLVVAALNGSFEVWYDTTTQRSRVNL